MLMLNKFGGDGRTQITKTDWQTPKVLWEKIKGVGFNVDAAADSNNHLCDSWYGPGSALGEDALLVDQWLSPAFCNPPYGRGIEQWLDKFIEQSRLGAQIMALLPANIEARWWFEKVIEQHCDIFFLVGRVPFVDPTRTKPSQPNHGSALVLYEDITRGRIEWLDWKHKAIL